MAATKSQLSTVRRELQLACSRCCDDRRRSPVVARFQAAQQGHQWGSTSMGHSGHWARQPLGPCTATVASLAPNPKAWHDLGRQRDKPGKNYSTENRRLPVAASIRPRTTTTSNLHPIPPLTSWALARTAAPGETTFLQFHFDI